MVSMKKIMIAGFVSVIMISGVSFAAGKKASSNPRIFMPVGLGMSFEEFSAQVNPSNTGVALDPNVVLTDSLTSKAVDGSKKVGKKIVNSTRNITKKSWEKTKSAATWTKNKVKSLKNTVASKIVKKKDDAQGTTDNTGSESTVQTEGNAPREVVDATEVAQAEDVVVADVAVTETAEIPTKWPYYGMNICLTKIAMEGGYPVFVAGYMTENEFRAHEQKYKLASEGKTMGVEVASNRVFECITDTCLIDEAIDSEFFFALINQVDAISQFNSTGNGSLWLIFVSDDIQVVREAAKHGMIGIHFVSVGQLCDDLLTLGLPAPHRARYGL